MSSLFGPEVNGNQFIPGNFSLTVSIALIFRATELDRFRCCFFRFHFRFYFLEKEDTRPREEIIREQLLTTIEQAYPNVLTMDDLVR